MVSEIDYDADRIILVVWIGVIAAYLLGFATFEETVVMLLGLIAIVVLNVPYRLDGGIDT